VKGLKSNKYNQMVGSITVASDDFLRCADSSTRFARSE